MLDCLASCLIVVDIQQRLAPATLKADLIVANTQILLSAARGLDIPILASEQYPKGLGPTLPEIRSKLTAQEIVPKTHFSCFAEPGFRATFNALARDQVVLCGMEAHVCVLQTALEMQDTGREVFVVTDAITARVAASKQIALERMTQAGIIPVTTEMVLFEWLRRSDMPAFKTLSALIK